MGKSCYILKRRDEIDQFKMIDDLNYAAKKAKLKILINENFKYKEDGSFDYTTANLANTFEENDQQEEFLMYICGQSDSFFDKEYDYIIKGGHLNRAIIIENYSDSEKILLDFVFEYLKLNVKDIFWLKKDRYLTFEEIKFIRSKDFDRDWPYKEPD